MTCDCCSGVSSVHRFSMNCRSTPKHFSVAAFRSSLNFAVSSFGICETAQPSVIFVCAWSRPENRGLVWDVLLGVPGTPRLVRMIPPGCGNAALHHNLKIIVDLRRVVIKRLLNAPACQNVFRPILHRGF